MTSFQAFKDAIDQLTDLEARTAHTAPVPYRYVGQIIRNTKVLLTAPANTFSNKPKFNLGGNDKSRTLLIGSIHRSFFADIHGNSEEGLSTICNDRGITVESNQKKQIEDLLQKIELETGHNLRVKRHTSRLRKKMRSIRPNLMDYVNTLLKQSDLTKEKQKTWKDFFEAITILRNKCSHSIFNIEESERKKLIAGGFQQSVNIPGEIIVGPRMYSQVANNILNFFDLFSA